MGRTNGVGVAGEVDVDFILRLDQAESAACAAALDAENRSERRFPESRYHVLAESSHGLSQANGGCSLAFSGGRGRDAGNDYHLAAPPVVTDSVEAYLGLVLTVWDDRLAAKSQFLCYVHDRPHTKTSDRCCATGRAGLLVDGANCSISAYRGKLGRKRSPCS